MVVIVWKIIIFTGTWCGYEVPGMILLCDLIVVKTCLCVFQRISASCVAVVALIRRVCFYVPSQKLLIGF